MQTSEQPPNGGGEEPWDVAPAQPPMAPKGKRGRPPWQPTKAVRSQVQAMHTFGIPEDTIALVLGVGAKALRRHCRVELDTGLALANAKVADFLFTGIVGMPGKAPFVDERNRILAAFFWLKTRAGWKETSTLEVVRAPWDMSDEELELAIELAERGPGGAGGKVASLAAYRKAKTGTR
jgi:hypothetical protein